MKQVVFFFDFLKFIMVLNKKGAKTGEDMMDIDEDGICFGWDLMV